MDQELHGPPGQEVGSEERPAKARRRRFLDQVWAVSGGVVQLEGRHPAAPAGGALEGEDDRLRHVTKAVPSRPGAPERRRRSPPRQPSMEALSTMGVVRAG